MGPTYIPPLRTPLHDREHKSRQFPERCRFVIHIKSWSLKSSPIDSSTQYNLCPWPLKAPSGRFFSL